MKQPIRVEPPDEYNRSLVDHVHPPDWQNPQPRNPYNLVVIGAGTAGLVTASGAAGLGARVALIERHLMGGDCLNVGCVPSKALIRCARAAAEVRQAGRFGVQVRGPVHVDFAGVMERMRRLRASIAPHDSARRFQSLGVDVFLGEATFDGRDRVRVGDHELRFSRACIAAGGRAAAPPIPGLETAGYLTNETVFTLTSLPSRLAVFGAGPIGCELAQCFARFGSEVFLIEALHGVLPKEEPEASEIVKKSLLADGIQVLCCGKEARVESEGATRRIFLESHGTSHQLEVGEILVAAGRTPNLEGLGLEQAEVEYTSKGVRVDQRLRTTNPRIFAAGDIASPYQFTHAADAMARIIVQNALFPFLPFKAKTSTWTMPWCTYTDPEVAHVGRYRGELEEAGVGFEEFTIPLRENDRAILEDDTEGFLLVLAEKRSGRLLGVTLVSRHAGDMISEATLAMVHRIGLTGFSSTIHPYPTEAEVFRRAGDAFRRTRLSPLLKTVLGRLMAWQR